MLSERLKEDLKNPWLRIILAAVGITVTVNIVFITYAFISPPNLVVKDYYERGKEYFHDAKVRDDAASTAWRLQLMLPNKVTTNKVVTCRVYAMDNSGTPIATGHVILSAYRPSDASHDFDIELQRTDRGTFSAPVSFPLPGHWDLIARIDSDGKHFDTEFLIFQRLRTCFVGGWKKIGTINF